MKRYFRETLGVTTMTENNFQQAELPAGCTDTTTGGAHRARLRL